MFSIRKMKVIDKQEVVDMMRVFYSSDAVATNGSEKIFENDFENCINSSPYLEGYVFENNSDVAGYAMVAKSFSTEYGKECIWIEDIYVKPSFQNLGIGTAFLEYITEKYKNSLIRLEVEKENTKAVSIYKKIGFEFMPYDEMKK